MLSDDKGSIAEIDKRSTETPELEAHGINEKALVRRMDWQIVPTLCVLYLLSFLDRTNIGNASLFGLQTDLNLTGLQYPICLALFFVFYVIFEVPSNMVMKAWRPSMWLPIIMIAWGICITLMGIVQNFGGLLAARIFLGITEAGLFPGVTFFLTMWYKKREVNFRISLFFSCATLAGAFGGLLARLINFMDGTGGLQGWRWIFILEGILTVVVAVASFFLLHDYPDTARFMNQAERDFAMARLKEDTDGLATRYDTKFVRHAFMDPKVWAFSAMYIGSLMPVYSFSLFSPTLVANLGYTAATAQLLSVPPYVLAAITTVSSGWLSDRVAKRGVFVIGLTIVGLVGFIMCIASPSPVVGYIGLFPAAAGIYPLIPLLISWGANNMGGATKRAVGMAIVVSVGNAGGVVSSFIYRAVDKPRYFPGHGTIIGFLFTSLLIAITMLLTLQRKNKKNAEALAARGRPWTAADKEAHEDEGDHAPFFNYQL